MKRGDVALVIWPTTDLTGSKSRPAVVVQADFLNGILDDTILALMTGTRRGIPGTEARIDPTVETASGLSKVCVTSCSNILTIEQATIDRAIGYLPDLTVRQIEDCLKTVMQVP